VEAGASSAGVRRKKSSGKGRFLEKKGVVILCDICRYEKGKGEKTGKQAVGALIRVAKGRKNGIGSVCRFARGEKKKPERGNRVDKGRKKEEKRASPPRPGASSTEKTDLGDNWLVSPERKKKGGGGTQRKNEEDCDCRGEEGGESGGRVANILRCLLVPRSRERVHFCHLIFRPPKGAAEGEGPAEDLDKRKKREST